MSSLLQEQIGEPPSIATLRGHFSLYLNTHEGNVSGVRRFKSKQAGATLGITIHTHGNEPCGLAVSYFLGNWLQTHELYGGQIIIVLNNLKATEQYFKALDMPDRTPEEKVNKAAAKRNRRFCNINMNRLPRFLSEPGVFPERRYEILRAQELLPIWNEFDVALDIHSTSQEMKPVIITNGELHKDLVAGFPIDTIITGIEKIMVARPVVEFYGDPKRGCRTLAIEAGSHENPTSFTNAIGCTMALLQNLGMIKEEDWERDGFEYYLVFPVTGSLRLPADDPSYKMTKIWKPFEPIPQGQIMASGPMVNYVAKDDGYCFVGRPTDEPTDEERMFIIGKPEKVMIF